jgi:outer membrane protein insertion porin family
VISKLFNGGREFKQAYNAMNSPMQYRFVQYNFGIGMPF